MANQNEAATRTERNDLAEESRTDGVNLTDTVMETLPDRTERTDPVNPVYVMEVRGKRTFAGPGMWAFDAEARVVDRDETELYVSVNVYDAFKHYKVSRTSTFDAECGGCPDDAEPDEEFEKWVAAQIVGNKNDPALDGKEGADLTVAEQADTDTIESYDRQTEAKASRFWKVFAVLDKVIDRMETPV